MHRQSLGSPPSSKLPIEETPKRSATSALSGDGDNDKPLKPPPMKPERLLHLIPVLTALCFLLLYLSSHRPSQTDLAQVGGFNWPSHTEDTNDIDGLGRFLKVERSQILGIRSLQNLHGRPTRNPEYRPHRKLADF